MSCFCIQFRLQETIALDWLDNVKISCGLCTKVTLCTSKPFWRQSITILINTICIRTINGIILVNVVLFLVFLACCDTKCISQTTSPVRFTRGVARVQIIHFLKALLYQLLCSDVLDVNVMLDSILNVVKDSSRTIIIVAVQILSGDGYLTLRGDSNSSNLFVVLALNNGTTLTFELDVNIDDGLHLNC